MNMKRNEQEPLRAMAGAEITLGDDAVMYMPGGRHTIHCALGDRASAIVTVDVDRSTAAVLRASLAALNAENAPQKALFDKEHESKEAMAWPTGFEWRDIPEPGVYARVEFSSLGESYVKGKVLRAFSPSFYTDADLPKRSKVVKGQTYEMKDGLRGSVENPAKIRSLDFPYAGTLTNNPAFREILPLWAKAATNKISADGSAGAAGAITGTTKQKDRMKAKTTEELAALRAKVTELGQEVDQLSKLDQTLENAEALRAKQAELEEANEALEAEEANAELRARNKKLEDQLIAQRTKDAKEAVRNAVKRGVIASKDEALQARWEKKCTEDPDALEMLNSMRGIPAAQPSAGGITKLFINPDTVSRLQAKEGPANIIKALGEKMKLQRNIRGFDAKSCEERGTVSREMAALFAKDVSNNTELLGMPIRNLNEALRAAQASDTLGTLSGTLVIQRTLEFFRINYPMFKAIYTDFSDQPALLNQPIDTRIVSKPAVQTYNPTLGADGRPLGWNTASAATTTSVQPKIDEHVGVPVVFDANTLASTIRRLFDEQAPAMSYALAAYFVAKIYALCTAANFNGYAAVNGNKVPVAYATYAKGLGDFARSAAVDLNAIFNPNEVPLHDRALLLNSGYYGQMGKDPSLVTFWAAQRNPEIITEGELPKMSKFVPIEAPDFPSSANRVGMALQKNALIAISRIPQDYSKVLPGSSYGNVTQISDPETGLTVMLVEYVNHTGGYAEMRMEVMIGAGVGDKRAGLVITSQ